MSVSNACAHANRTLYSPPTISATLLVQPHGDQPVHHSPSAEMFPLLLTCGPPTRSSPRCPPHLCSCPRLRSSYSARPLARLSISRRFRLSPSSALRTRSHRHTGCAAGPHGAYGGCQRPMVCARARCVHNGVLGPRCHGSCRGDSRSCSPVVSPSTSTHEPLVRT